MNKLTVFYDNHCDLCRRCRLWVEAQPAYVRIDFRPLRDPATRTAFPDLDRYEPEKELVVFTDEGNVYRGSGAWILILWGLENWRDWSFRFARPGWRPLVGRFVSWISTHRMRRLPGRVGDESVLKSALDRVADPYPGSRCEMKARRLRENR